MPFTNEDKTLIKNLILVQRIWLTEDTGVISEEKLQKGRDWTRSLKIQETGRANQRHESGRPKHAQTEENVITMDELVGLLCTKPGRERDH